jgi:hypothetical protein
LEGDRERAAKQEGRAMTKQLYRVAGSRLFTRLLSLMAVAVLAFAALELVFVPQALAGIACCTNSSKTDCICDPSSACNILRNGKLYSFQVIGKTCWNTSISGDVSTIRSELECTSISEETELDATSLRRTGTQFCEVSPSPGEQLDAHHGSGVCQIDLTYSRPAGLATCEDNTEEDTSTLTYSAFCGEVTSGSPQKRLTVTGTLKCPRALNNNALPNFCQGNEACILNIGIVDPKCSVQFKDHPDLPDGQVLSFSQTMPGLGCSVDAEPTNSALLTQYCNGGTFDNAPVDCTLGAGKAVDTSLTGKGAAQPAVQFDVFFSPTSLNIHCGPNNNDTWHFTITANQHLPDLTRIVPSSLAVEGVSGQVTCDPVNTTVVPNTRTCHINACQQDPDVEDLGTVACNSNPPGSADLTVTGNLDTLTGPPIFGEDLGHKTTGQCQPLPS